MWEASQESSEKGFYLQGFINFVWKPFRENDWKYKKSHCSKPK